MRTSLLLAAVVAPLALSAAPAAAQQADSVAALKAEVEMLRERDKAATQRLEALERRLQQLETAGRLTAISDAEQAEMRGTGVGVVQPAPAAPQVAQAVAEPDRKAPAPTEAVELVTQAQQNNYGSRFSLDPGISYAHSSNARLNLSGFLALDAIFLGLISIDEVDSDIVTTDLTARYGLTDRLQFDLNVPYVLRRSSFKSGGVGADASALAERTISTRGLGDISAGLSYRVFGETARRPDVVLFARVKAPTGRDPFGIELIEVEGTEGNLTVPATLPTGTGVWGASAGVSLLKTIDPLVVFGNLTYFKNFEGKFDDLDEADGDQPGRARLGDAIQYGAGVAFALNDSSSISLSFTQRFVRSARVRRDADDMWQRVIGSDANVGLLNAGATFSLSDRLALLANVSAGITDDAPDMTVSLRLPYRF